MTTLSLEFLKNHPIQLILSCKHPLHNPIDIAKASLSSGAVGIVQIRDKISETREMMDFAQTLSNSIAELNLGYNVPLLFNDEVALALACNLKHQDGKIVKGNVIQGVHLGQQDMPLDFAREILGKGAILGLTVKNISHIQNSPLALADYVSCGGVFTTHNKVNLDSPLGVDGLQTMVHQIKNHHPHLPICAIAGINRDNIHEVSRAGVDFVAVIDALCQWESLEMIHDQAKLLAKRFKENQPNHVRKASNKDLI